MLSTSVKERLSCTYLQFSKRKRQQWVFIRWWYDHCSFPSNFCPNRKAKPFRMEAYAIRILRPHAHFPALTSDDRQLILCPCRPVEKCHHTLTLAVEINSLYPFPALRGAYLEMDQRSLSLPSAFCSAAKISILSPPPTS